MINVTVEDTLGVVRAVVGFAAILLCPGYLLGWATDLFGFRTLRPREKLAWAVALSFAVTPIFTQLAARVVGVGGMALVAGLCACVSAGMAIRNRGRFSFPKDPNLRKLGVFVLAGSAVLLVELLDFQIGSRLHLGVSALDQGYRVGFTNAVARSGVPPANPFYHPGGAVALRYYYFWYALCAVCMKLVHVTARQALIASSMWCGIGLTAMIALYMRHFLRIREGLNRHILTASLLLTVTGADLVPVFYKLFAHNDFGGEMEWWSPDQIASWMDTLIWVPNHASGLIACLTVFLLLWRTAEVLPARQKRIAVLLAGVAAASAFGLSIYIAVGLAMMVVAWAIRQRRWSGAARLCAVGAVAGVLLAPYVHDLLGTASGNEGRTASGPTHVLSLSLRKMLDPTPVIAQIAAIPRFAHLVAAHPVLLDQGLRLLLLVPGYGLELGFFGAVLVFAWIDRAKLDEARRTALFFALTGLAIVSVVRSAVIGNNDFGTRAALLPCFFLLLLGTRILLDVQDQTGRAVKLRGTILAPLLLLGVAGTAFQALALRLYIPIHSSHRAPGFEDLGEAVLDTRNAYEATARLIPANAVIQSDPSGQGSYFYVANMLFTPRAIAVDAAVDCGSVFGGNPAPCEANQEAIRHLFHQHDETAEDARELCSRIGIDYLAASRRDAAWWNPHGWVWSLPAVAGPERFDVNTGSVRIVTCGTLSPK